MTDMVRVLGDKNQPTERHRSTFKELNVNGCLNISRLCFDGFFQVWHCMKQTGLMPYLTENLDNFDEVLRYIFMVLWRYMLVIVLFKIINIYLEIKESAMKSQCLVMSPGKHIFIFVIFD